MKQEVKEEGAGAAGDAMDADVKQEEDAAAGDKAEPRAAGGKKHRAEGAPAAGAAPAGSQQTAAEAAAEAHRSQGTFALRPAGPAAPGAADVLVSPSTVGAKTPGGGEQSTAKVRSCLALLPLLRLVFCTALQLETQRRAWHLPEVAGRPARLCPCLPACRSPLPPRLSRLATTSSATSLSPSMITRQRPSSQSWQTTSERCASWRGG